MIVCLIPARKGSKRIKKKNILKFFGKPMIAHSIRIAQKTKIFDKIYENRPIKNNHGGMRFPHMFAMYYMLKKIKPDFVVESGIFKGQSTWLIEKTLPEAKILSIDIDLNQTRYNFAR